MEFPFYNVVMIGPYPENPSFMQGGVQAAVYGLSRTLRRRSGAGGVHVVSLPTGMRTRLSSAMLDGIKVTYLHAPWRFLASTVVHIPAVLREIRSVERPLVHVHGTGLIQTVLLALLRLKGLPLVWTLHGITEKETLQYLRNDRTPANLARYLLYRFLERLCLRIVPTIIVDTPYVRACVAATRGVHVVPQGISAAELDASRAQRHGGNLLVSVGAFSARKGHIETVDAFARVLERVPAARLVIAGHVVDAVYLDALRRRVARLGLEHAVELRSDAPRGCIIAMLGQARAFVLHSREESQGIALCEALAVGVPVVATRVGGIPDVVTDQQDGILVSHGDQDAYVDAIVRVLTDDSLHARLSRQARISSARFDWTMIAGEIAAIYRQTVADAMCR